MAVSQSQLIQAAARARPTIVKSLQDARSRGIRTAFLCHSHRDQTLVTGLVALLNEANWNVYVDWNDPVMPDVPDRVTAQRIQEQIGQTDFFLFLATPNALASRWCPWEIGYANGVKPIDTIVVIPTRSGSVTHGNEYLDLYRSIDFSREGRLAVWPAAQRTGGSYILR
jgi:hypothetical protein